VLECLVLTQRDQTSQSQWIERLVVPSEDCPDAGCGSRTDFLGSLKKKKVDWVSTVRKQVIRVLTRLSSREKPRFDAFSLEMRIV